MKFTQQPSAVIMVRPKSFGFNPETSESNVFQQNAGDEAKNAVIEFERMVDMLHSHEISVMVFDDSDAPAKPDAIFPNNWMSTHPDGTIILYPLMAPNRRPERRSDILEVLKDQYSVSRVVDFSDEERAGNFLEGTGSLVFDHPNKVVYACRSPRTTPALVQKVAETIGYRYIVFDAVDGSGKAVYHTNVMMSVGEKFALLCLDAIKSEEQQDLILDSFSRSDHRVISISDKQMSAFAGNALEVKAVNGDAVVVMSEAGFHSLLPGQINAISEFADILPISIPTIEKIGGGSVRCMMTGIHLPSRNN